MRPGPRTRHEPGVMNKQEAEYAARLDLLKAAGQILDWRFEALTLTLTRINRGVRLTPDFLVIYPDHFELHEVKGHWEEDARRVMKVAAEMFPWFDFRAFRRRAKKDGGGWEEEAFALNSKEAV